MAVKVRGTVPRQPWRKGKIMASTKNNSTTPDVSAATPDDYRAYADFLAAGNVGLSFGDWYASPAGEAQRVAFADQQAAANRKERMSNARAVWRDFKVNGQLTTYSAAKARALMAYLSSLDLDSLPEPDAKATAAEDAADAKADDAK